MKRDLDKTIGACNVGAVCGGEYDFCPVMTADTPFCCRLCGFYTDSPDCHRCFCTACHIDNGRWKQQILSRRRAHPLQCGLFDVPPALTLSSERCMATVS